MGGGAKNGVSRMRKISTAIVALATLALAAPASAAEIWFTGWTGTTAVGGGHLFTDGTVNVRVSAWSIDTGGIIHEAPLSGWSGGLYIENSDEDNWHTVDNSGWHDFLLFQFDRSVELDKAWFNTDSSWSSSTDTDATIGYGNFVIPYTSQPGFDGDPFAGGPNFYASDTDPFEFGDSFRGINPEGYTGNFWLIGASFDSPDEYKWGRAYNYYDSFKLKKLTYTIPTPSVPEPGTWLMMILGFGLVGGMMRREKRKDAPALA